MPRLSLTKTSYCETRPLSSVIQVTPFIEQRDIDHTRIPQMVTVFESQISATNEITLDAPIVLLECAAYDHFLLNRDHQRVHTVVVDGQHRLEALRTLVQRHPRCRAVSIPVFVHTVETIQTARQLQYHLFEQQPVTQYDKIPRTDYHLSDLMQAWIDHYRHHHPTVAKRHFKNGRYHDPHSRPRRLHFMVDEFSTAIKNSSHVQQWIQREIQCSELLCALNTLIQQHRAHLISLPLEEQMKRVHIPKPHNYQLFLGFLEKCPFQMLPYVYYKNYEGLVNDVEREMGIGDGDDGEEEDGEDDDNEEGGEDDDNEEGEGNAQTVHVEVFQECCT